MRHGAFTIIEVMIALLILAIAISSVFGGISSIQSANRAAAEDRRAQEIAQIIIERLQGELWNNIGRQPWSWHRREDAPSLTGMQYCDELPGPTVLEFKHRPLVDEPGISMGADKSRSLYAYLEELNDEIGGGGVDWSNFTFDVFGLPYLTDNQVDEYGVAVAEAQAPSSITVPAVMTTKFNTPDRYNWLQFVGLLDKHSTLENCQVFLEYYRQDALLGVSSRADWIVQRNNVGNRYPQSHTLFDLAAEGTTLDRDAVLAVVVITWDRAAGGTGRFEVMTARRR